MTNTPFTFGNSAHTPGRASGFQPPESLQTQKKITLVTGFLGAGKTTLINALLPEIPKNTRFIINDIGAINIDAKRINAEDTVAMQNSCVCCGSFKELIDAIESSSQDHILIEPTGIATPQRILGYLQEKGYDVSVVTVVNTDSYGNNISDEITAETFIGQVQVANILATRGNPQHKKDFEVWAQKYIGEATSIISLPQVARGVEILPGQGQSEFYRDFWKLIEAVRGNVGVDINNILTGHMSGNSESYTGLNIDDTGIKNYIKYLESQGIRVLRAKGINTDGGFDYEGGEFIETPELGFSCFVIITAGQISREQKEAIKRFTSTTITMKKTTKKIPRFEEADVAIDILVGQYDEYMQMYREKEGLEAQLSDETLSEEDRASTERAINTMAFKLSKLGDAMKFDSPYIWIGYKKAAYKGEENEISTLGALRKHCAIDDQKSRYICKKRFFLLNKILRERFQIDLSQDNDRLHAGTNLEDILTLPEIEKLSCDEEFMRQWLGYEYFERGGKTMKWENFN